MRFPDCAAGGLAQCVATALLVWAALLLVAGNCSLVLGIPAGHNVLAPVLLATSATVVWVQRRGGGGLRAPVLCLGLAGTALVSIFALAGLFIDITGDGQWYHLEAIIRLADGWNPVYDRLHDDGWKAFNPIVFVEGYPHGLWLVETFIYRLTGDIEQGKGWNLVFALASFLLSASALRAWGLSRGWSWAIGGLAALNPVVIAQAMSYYNDGVVSSLLLCMIAATILLWKAPSLDAWAAFVAALVFLINTKFLGLAYSVALVGTVLLLGVLWRAPWRDLRRYALVSAAAGAFAVLFVGFHPYVEYTVKHGNPMAALASIEFRTAHQIESSGRVAPFLWSLFGAPRISLAPEVKVAWKTPFRFTTDELLVYRHWPDPDIGALGPYFAETLLLSLLALTVAGGALWRRDKRMVLSAALVIAVFLVAILIKRPTWFMRYNAYFYLTPIVVCLLLLKAAAASRIAMATAGLICFLLALSDARYVHLYRLGQTEYTSFVTERWTRAREASRRGPVRVHFTNLRANRVRWKNYGIRFHEVATPQELGCAEPAEIWMNHLFYCPPDAKP